MFSRTCCPVFRSHAPALSTAIARGKTGALFGLCGRLVGLLVGFSGVVALVGLDVAGRTDELLGAGAILLAATGYAAGPMVLKRQLSDLEPIPLKRKIFFGLLIATPIIALIAGGIAIAIIASTFALGTTLDGIFDDVGTGFGG